MDSEVKQRNRRKRAQRMQAIRDTKKGNDSGEEDEEAAAAAKPQRPPARRKKPQREPLVEEDIIDGFAILGFKTYEDLEAVVKVAAKENIRRLVDIDKLPKHEPRSHIPHHISVHSAHTLTSLTSHDPATSDDSGRASERLTGSSVAPRDADSSRDRLSDASSRCSSGKGYICDSEGEDDKGSDASSVIFPSTPASRKHEFPGALPPSLPLISNGQRNSPVPAPTPPNLPVPSPAPAQQPPQHPIAAVPASATTATQPPTTYATPPSPHPPPASVPAAVSVPVTMPQPAAAASVPHHHHHPIESTPGASRTDSPAVATSANAGTAQYHPPSSYHMHHHHQQQQQQQQQQHPPLYTPYAAATATVSTSLSTATTVTASKERESFSNVTSLSRSSTNTGVATITSGSSLPPPQQQPQQLPSTTTTPAATVNSSSSSLAKQQNWVGSPRPTPPMHAGFPSTPLFSAPLPPSTIATAGTPAVAAATNPNPFSAENLFQPITKKPLGHHQECLTPSNQDPQSKFSQITMPRPISNQADMLRRELDNRFLASQDRSLPVAPPPYLRTEMHQHQHHHTHVHQHTTSLLPPPPSTTLFPAPLYKDIPKLSTVDSPFYRQNIGVPNYPGYSPGLLHPGLTTGPTPFMPPNHLPTFQPKPAAPDPGKPKIVKSGKWNAMHVRVAWEIYHHQQKSDPKNAAKTDLLRPPSHLFSPSVHHTRTAHELPFPHRAPAAFDHQPLFAAPPSHIGSTMSPFTRYGAAGFAAAAPSPANPFGLSPFAPAAGRELSLGALHDPWRGLQRTVPGFPPTGVGTLAPTLPGLGPPPAPWGMKPDPILEQQREREEREQRERERMRREREERERREKEEKQRRLEQQQQMERERERREKERREMERREMERERERERERLLQQQRYAESTKHLNPALRDRSPLRNGDATEVRVKEEPRPKEEDLRYHPYLRHPSTLGPPSLLDRTRLMGHYPPPPPPLGAPHWPPHPDPYYRYEPPRYNPLMDAALRAEEEQRKLFGAYGGPHQLRAKDASLMHLRAGPGPPVVPQPPPAHKMCATPPTDPTLKKEETAPR